MIVEGILAIQSGDNPRIVKEKLESYLSAPIIEDEDDEAVAA
jgi:flagellar motor component MotA